MPCLYLEIDFTVLTSRQQRPLNGPPMLLQQEGKRRSVQGPSEWLRVGKNNLLQGHKHRTQITSAGDKAAERLAGSAGERLSQVRLLQTSLGLCFTCKCHGRGTIVHEGAGGISHVSPGPYPL